MSMKKTMRELLASGQVIVGPEAHDTLSLRTVEACGFQAVVISSGAFTGSICGIPDFATMTMDEAAWYMERMCAASSLPIILDGIEGFGQPLQTYQAVKKIAQAGAGGILITEQYDVHSNIYDVNGILPRKQGEARVKAAVEAAAGTDCIIVARVDPDPVKYFDEVVERMNRYKELGADVVLPVKLNVFQGTPEEREAFVNKLGHQVPGVDKWYPDLSYHNGIPELDITHITESGFKFIGVHYLMETAMLGMVEATRRIMEAGNDSVLNDLRKRFACASATTEKALNDYDYWNGNFRDVDRAIRIEGNTEPYQSVF